MKKNLLYLVMSSLLLITMGCSKKFLEEMKSYDKYDEPTVFQNQALTGAYVDRMYNFYFSAYRSPIASVVGLHNETRTAMTEELGGTVTNYTNPNITLQTAAQGDNYFGTALATSGAPNNPYSRIRYVNFLLEKIDEYGQNLDETFRNRAKGQAYFLRALQYFDLVRIYGGVPIVTTVQDASLTDETIRLPRSTSSECFAQIVKDLDEAASLLPMQWDAANYGRLTAAGALAMKSRVLLTAASPLFNKDWDNTGSEKWQKALDASLDAENKLTAAGYGLFGANAKDWAEMTFRNDNAFNKEALIVQLLSATSVTNTGINNGWESSLRPADYRVGSGGRSVPKEMLDLFPLANGLRPTAENGYVDTFFFENRDPRFYRTFAFSGSKWGIATNANKSTWFYRWKANASATSGTFYRNNQTNSPALVRKMSNPAADSTAYQFSGTDIFEYRYAELLLNIAECYAAKNDITNAVIYLGKIRARVYPSSASANNYGIGTPGSKYEALEACLYERRVELAYEGKRFWDAQRWMLYDNTPESGNSVQKLKLTPINGTKRSGYYWQSKTYGADPLTAADRNILIDPDAANFATEIGRLKAVYQSKFQMAPLDQEWDRVNNVAVTILFRPNYYLSGLPGGLLGNNPWLLQTKGWLDYSGGAGTFDYQQ